jgi:outer membrane protein OmpA-like peptidoglycan-associated protein
MSRAGRCATAARCAGALALAGLAATGCARPDWVRELVGGTERRLEARLAEDAARAEARVAAEGVRVDALEARLGEIEARVETTAHAALEARAAAVEARERATVAQTHAGATDARLSRLWAARHLRRVVESVDVHFPFDRWALTDAAETRIVDVARELRRHAGLSVELVGYTDTRGARDYNLELSGRRVEAVRRVLAAQGVGLERIHGVGLGPLPDPGVPQEHKRRVTVRILE